MMCVVAKTHSQLPGSGMDGRRGQDKIWCLPAAGSAFLGPTKCVLGYDNVGVSSSEPVRVGVSHVWD